MRKNFLTAVYRRAGYAALCGILLGGAVGCRTRLRTTQTEVHHHQADSLHRSTVHGIAHKQSAHSDSLNSTTTHTTEYEEWCGVSLDSMHPVRAWRRSERTVHNAHQSKQTAEGRSTNHSLLTHVHAREGMYKRQAATKDKRSPRLWWLFVLLGFIAGGLTVWRLSRR